LALGTLVVALTLTFDTKAAAPPGWLIAGSAPGDYEFALDQTTAASGKESASITAKPGARSDGFGALMQTITAEHYRGGRWRLSGYLRTQAANRAQMWMRVDGPNGAILSFDNMDSRPVTGTTGWTHYDIVLDVPSDSRDITFGFLLLSSGKVWGDDFKLEQVDATVPVTAAQARLPDAPVNADFEDTGSNQAAVWTRRTLRAVFYVGDYTCDLLYESVRRVLLQLGARASDLDVKEYECFGDRSGVEAAFSVLVPSGAAGASAAGPLIQARWESVELRFDRIGTGSRIRGSLALPEERVLVELVKTRILPLFPTRAVKFNGSDSAQVEVLEPR
jgi:hypothetical protein